MRRPDLRVLFFVALVLPVLAAAADGEPKAGAEETPLRRLVRDVGVRIHKPFVVDPRAPETIDLGSLKPQEVTYRQLLSVLEMNGMVVTESEGLLQVVPDANARQAPTRIVDPDDIRTADEEWVTVVVPLKSVSAAQLVPILRPLMPQAAHLAALTDRNALLIVDRSANARRMIGIARALEKLPPRPAEPPAPKGSG